MAATAAALAPARPSANLSVLAPSIDALPAFEREILDLFLNEYVSDPSRGRELQQLTTEYAILRYRCDHLRRIEYGYYAERLIALCEELNRPIPTSHEERSVLEARVLREDCDGPKVVFKLIQQQRYIERQTDKILHSINDIERMGSQNESIEALIAQQLANESYLAGQLSDENNSDQPSHENDHQELASFSENTPTPRSSRCPCGSGQKYKRCCGRSAPAVLHGAA